VVGDGRLRFSAATGPKIEVVLGPGDVQAIPPDVEHEVLPLGPVRFSVEFLAVDRFEEGGTERTADETELTKRRVPEEGGDPACWAQLLCPECGAVLEDDSHPSSCHANPERITNVTEGSVGEFIDHVAAHQPAPAGGAVAALCTAQASALLAMVARYSGGTTAADHVAVASTVLRESESLQARSLELMQLDVAAFMAVASAYALPRATREAEKVRSAAVEIALVDAAEPQAAVVEIAVDLSALIGQLLPFANRSVVTDLAAAAAATRAALFIARLNVEGNLTRASDPTVQTAFAGRLADVDRMLQKMDAVSNAIRSDVQDEGLPNRLHRRHTGAVPRPADTATEPSSLQSKDVR
jgi:formiminotetrahydrofolate cyclodeaminase